MSKWPEDFGTEVVSERPMGTEAESTLQVGHRGEYDIPVIQYISASAVEKAGFRRFGDFLNYGCKLHVEPAGQKVEVASREGLGARETAREDAHGITIAQSVVRASGIKHDGLFRIAGTFIPVRGQSSDAQKTGTTVGFHHNFLIPGYITEDFELLSEVTAAHLATRLWAMAGTLRQGGFTMSQKIWGIGVPVIKGYGNRTGSGKKPMAAVLLGDPDTLGDMTWWARFEDRSVDPSFNVEMTELQLATTSLVLRLVEHAHKLSRNGVSGRDRLLGALSLKNPVVAAKEFAGDLTLRKTAETTNGEMVTALDVQERLVNFAMELSSKVLLPADEQRAIYNWARIVRIMRLCNPKLDDYAFGAEDINFVPRHVYLRKHFERNKLNARNETAAIRNLRWDRIEPEGYGLKYMRALFEKRGRAWPGEPSLPRTRGALRAVLASQLDTEKVGWTYVTNGGKTTELFDFFQTTLEAA